MYKIVYKIKNNYKRGSVIEIGEETEAQENGFASGTKGLQRMLGMLVTVYAFTTLLRF